MSKIVCEYLNKLKVIDSSEDYVLVEFTEKDFYALEELGVNRKHIYNCWDHDGFDIIHFNNLFSYSDIVEEEKLYIFDEYIDIEEFKIGRLNEDVYLIGNGKYSDKIVKLSKEERFKTTMLLVMANYNA